MRNFARSAAPRSMLLVALAGALVLGGCGDDGGADPEADGARAQATERLVAFGLDEDDATCLADELGADVVNETGELSALMDGDDYRAAAEECLDAG